MPQTAITPTHVPFTSQFITNNGQQLIVVFSTKPNSETDIECGQVIVLDCNDDGIPDLTLASVIWTTGCGEPRTVTSDDTDTDFTVVIDPDNSDPVTTITVTIDLGIAKNRNNFQLNAIIDGTDTLLAKGIIYTDYTE